MRINFNYPTALIVLIIYHTWAWLVLAITSSYWNKGFYDGIVVGFSVCMILRGIVKSIRMLKR